MPETTIIEIGGRRYRVTCLPDSGQSLNVVETYLKITDRLKLMLREDRRFAERDIEQWISKFPKPIK